MNNQHYTFSVHCYYTYKCKLNTYITSRKATVQHGTTLKQYKSLLNSVKMLASFLLLFHKGG
jgi:hypothetical protein